VWFTTITIPKIPNPGTGSGKSDGLYYDVKDALKDGLYYGVEDALVDLLLRDEVAYNEAMREYNDIAFNRVRDGPMAAIVPASESLSLPRTPETGWKRRVGREAEPPKKESIPYAEVVSGPRGGVGKGVRFADSPSIRKRKGTPTPIVMGTFGSPGGPQQEFFGPSAYQGSGRAAMEV